MVCKHQSPHKVHLQRLWRSRVCVGAVRARMTDGAVDMVMNLYYEHTKSGAVSQMH